MEKNKTGKYLKYAIGEIILVVIGILIALQLNAWKGEVQAKKELKASMNLMLDDLLQDISFYDSHIERIGNRVLVLTDFSQRNYSDVSIETIPHHLAYNIPTKNFGTTYVSLKEGRKFNMIENNGLKKKITSYYEDYCNQYSVFATWHEKFTTETIESYLLLNLPYQRNFKVDSKDVINELENGKLLGITNYQLTMNETALRIIKINKLQAEELSLFIKSEFNKNIKITKG